MKKLLSVLCGLLLSMNVGATEVEGVKLADRVHLGSRDLVLNGAGVRSKLIFDLYVAALYLGERKNSGDAVLADAGEKRIALHLLRDISAETLSEAFNKAIISNHTPAELAALDASLKQFMAIFAAMNEVKKGDVITLDYLPASGTRVGVNGTEKGLIVGAGFNVALLKVWLGVKPAQDDLKRKLLGGK
ncbi:MAG: chalcone isomerase family protein [Nitrosomonadales bacterium]|nr:chalcone isomerase family protein [Nitrosomonadales bacterium]